MKVRQFLTTAALAVAAVSFSASSQADAQQASVALDKEAAEYVSTALQTTITDLNKSIKQDVVAANYYFTPDVAKPVLLATVEASEIKSKG